MSQDIITFYDIRASIKPLPSFSPNTLRVRYALNYKGIAYKTVWVEYPDIEELCKSIGAAPTSKKPNGELWYTLPVIQDPSTGIVLSDGPEIVEYLDRTYPSTPTLLPRDTVALQLAFCSAVVSRTFVIYGVFTAVVPERALNPISHEFWKTTRSQLLGKKKFEDVAPTGEERVAVWKKFEEGVGEVEAWLKKSEGPFVTGDKPCFVDFTLAAIFISLRAVLGEEREWRDMAIWQSGRWVTIASALEEYHREFEL